MGKTMINLDLDSALGCFPGTFRRNALCMQAIGAGVMLTHRPQIRTSLLALKAMMAMIETIEMAEAA